MKYLFRGKDTEGNWHYGYYVYRASYGTHEIIVSKDLEGGKYIDCSHEVIPETVGQYTGLDDKEGNKIFEGDILYCYKCTYRLIHDIGKAYELHEVGNDKVFFLFKYHKLVTKIGNIHDNPELIEG